jgi:hypothetical protein
MDATNQIMRYLQTKQNKTKQNKTKQSKAKQSKAKQSTPNPPPFD